MSNKRFSFGGKLTAMKSLVSGEEAVPSSTAITPETKAVRFRKLKLGGVRVVPGASNTHETDEGISSENPRPGYVRGMIIDSKAPKKKKLGKNFDGKLKSDRPVIMESSEESDEDSDEDSDDSDNSEASDLKGGNSIGSPHSGDEKGTLNRSNHNQTTRIPHQSTQTSAQSTLAIGESTYRKQIFQNNYEKIVRKREKEKTDVEDSQDGNALREKVLKRRERNSKRRKIEPATNAGNDTYPKNDDHSGHRNATKNLARLHEKLARVSDIEMSASGFWQNEKTGMILADTDTTTGNETYRAFMDKLAQCNVDEYVDLPQIAVMGDTSSGKSSLLSMISMVELPSNDKLTTRCPIMLQMRKADKRSAIVKVNWKDRPEGSNIDFAPRQVSESNWDELTSYISDAQAHIVTKQNKEVARDVVSVEMTGPHCENLTLIDLPGIVRSHGKDESANLSEDIQALMSDYLQNPRCVILAVLPANVDFHNSQIMAEALKVDPDTKRTIPVLTKPDLIDLGAEGSVKALLLGKKTQDFEMGFHMVKGRGQDALNKETTIADGLAQEASFFYKTEPWRRVEDKSLFGTKNLRVKLGELQMRMIRQSFDSIVSEMKQKRDDAVESRSCLGEIPSELVEKRALFRRVTDDICRSIGPLVYGGNPIGKRSILKKKPSAQFHLASNDFMSTLSKSRLANISKIAVGVDVIAFVDSKEVKGTVQYMKDNQVYLRNHRGCTGIERRGGTKAGSVYERWSEHEAHVMIVAKNGLAYFMKPIPLEMVRRDPEWIRTLIEENRSYDLPIFINTDVFKGIVADLIDEDWRGPAEDLLNHTAGLLETATNKYIKSISDIESLPKLRHFLLCKSSELVDELKNESKVRVTDYINGEHVPFTQNHYLFENLSKLRSQRLMDEILAVVGSGDGEVKKSAVASTVKMVFERNQARSVDDHMAEEMQHALNAYGKVAMKRFIDAIPMICSELMRKYDGRLNDILSNVMESEIDRLVVAPLEKQRTMKDYEKKIATLDAGIAAVKTLY